MQLYCVSVSPSDFTPTDEQLLLHVSEARRAKILRHRSAEGQRLSLYAALTARMGIALLTGRPAEALSFTQEERKKPFVHALPEIDFSYSHTQGKILCAVSNQGKVGADVELLRQPPLSVLKRFYHPEEQKYVSGGNASPSRPDEVNARFFEIWTKKEAYTKYLGIGLTVELSEINTLSPKLAEGFLTWTEGNHICSVYYDKTGSCPPSPILLTEQEIAAYFSEK